MKYSFPVVVAISAALTGCATVQPATTIQLRSSFDAVQAQKMLEPGRNKINGSALMRQKGGGIVHCGGNEVMLIPVTEYATERMGHIYGSNQNGFLPVARFKRKAKFEPDLPEYITATRKVTCDAQGMFEFDSVKDGKYYITTHIIWDIDYAYQGGLLMQRVDVSGGETKKVVLSH